MYVQPFTLKPANEEEAREAVRRAQDRYDQARGEYQRYLYSGKPGKQRRFNQVTWAKRGLEDAQANLREIQDLEPRLFHNTPE